jgi:adenylate cyclase
VPGRALASDEAVRASADGEQQHWTPDERVVLRGRDVPTSTWVLRAD